MLLSLQRSSVTVLTAACILAFGTQSSFSSVYPLPITDPNPSAIACMQRLPDGAAVCVHRKCVTRVAVDHLYIEEADRSAGIRVVFGGFYPPTQLEASHLVSFAGQLGTVGAERVINCTSELDCDLNSRAPIMSLGMTMSAIQGWPIDLHDPNGTRVHGLVPLGLLVKIAGKVTATNWADEEGYFIYLDDGWNKMDRSEVGTTGVRVYSNVTPAPGEFLAAVGVLGSRTYDPTPSGPNGDEFPIPVIRCNYGQEPYAPIYQPDPRQLGQVSGRVRLIGQTAPGRSVRIYTQNDSVTVDNVSDEFKPFTLRGIPPIDPLQTPPVTGGVVTASASGSVSDTRNAGAGDTDVDFELTAADTRMEVKSDSASIAICSSEQAHVSAMLRDCEGKGIANRQVKLATTKGSFLEAPGHPSWVVRTTDTSGFVTATLTATPDNSGVAAVTATDYPDELSSAQTSIVLRGPDVTVGAYPKYMTTSGNSTITAVVTNGGAPIPSAAVTFRTDHGIFQESGANSHATQADSYGLARATLVVSTSGTARVLAVYTNSCSQTTVGWTVVAYKTAPWYSQGVQYSHPLVVDLDGDPDGKKEAVIVTSTGYLTALKANGTVYWNKITHLPGNNSPACAVLNSERSGRPCVFVPAESQQKMYAFAYNGNPLAGWPAGTNYRFIRVAPALADINLDGTPEVVAGDECCYVFSWNPTGDWKKTGTWDSSYLWRNLTESSSTTIFNTTCTLGEITGTPDPQSLNVIVGSNHSVAVFGFTGDVWGDFVNAPLYLTGYPVAAGGRVETSPAIGDIDGDGKNDMAVGSDDGSLYILSSRNGTWRGYPTGGMVRSSPAMCDLDGDGNLDAVVVGSDSGRLSAFNYLGQAPSGWDQGIKLNTSADYPIESSPVVADVNGDGRVEVVVGCNDGNLYAVYADGTNHMDGGVPTGPIAWARCCIPPTDGAAQILTSPVVDDIDHDSKVEILAAGDKGVYVFHFNAPYDPANQAQHPWPTFHADNQRTGCATPVPAPVKASMVGIVTRGGQPVWGAKVYIWGQDGSPVIEPHSDPPLSRGYILTVGSSEPTELGKGAYCISQLEPNTVYKIKVEAPGVTDPVWVENIAVTTGQIVVDVVVP